MSEKTVEFIMADHSRLVAENARLQKELEQVTAERDKLRTQTESPRITSSRPDPPLEEIKVSWIL